MECLRCGASTTVVNHRGHAREEPLVWNIVYYKNVFAIKARTLCLSRIAVKDAAYPSVAQCRTGQSVHLLGILR
jgi:hypothetical protein